LAAGARIISDLRGPKQDVVGHGVVLVENAIGGRVALMPWDANAPVHMTTHRAAQLTRVLGYLDPAHSYGHVEGGAWLVPQFLTDGERWRAAIWNASPDAIELITVHPPSGMPELTSAIQVNASGKQRPAELQGKRVRLSEPLQQWEFVVLW